ncbi:MAG TPA: hypothetical protein VJY35_06830 [Candidatus Eisenbacteria bacterium]|nr:hypothetical protein [Candidatus Eisenbacteria bacterium]
MTPSRWFRLTRFAAACAMALATYGLAATAFADPVAVIAAVKGKVEWTSTRRGPAQRAQFGRTLERGDRVTVAPGGSATLFFNDGNVIEMAGGSSIKVGGQIDRKNAAGPAIPGEVYASVQRFVAGGSREAGLVALSELRGPAEQTTPFLVSPRKTALMVDRPTFAWRAVPGATRYKLTLASADQGDLWTREVTGLSLAFPGDAPALAGSAEYVWHVEAWSQERSLRREGSVFQVIGPEQASTVRANLDRIRETTGGLETPAAHFLAGSYLSGLGLYLDASDHFGALCKLEPASPGPHEALGNVYSKVGLMDLAAAEFQRALTLSRDP